MEKSEFLAFCTHQNLEYISAGPNAFKAVVCEEFLGAVLSQPADFESAKPLLDAGDAYLVFGYRKRGTAFFYYHPTPESQVIAGSAEEVAHALAEKHASNIAQSHNVIYYHSEDLQRRDAAMAKYPKNPDESDHEYFQRLEEVNEAGTIAELYVTEAGYWDCTAPQAPVLSASSITSGMWRADHDDEEMRVLMILNESE